MRPLLRHISPTSLTRGTPTAVTDSTNWGINESVIKMIKIETDSEDWGLIISCDITLSGGMFDYIYAAIHTSGNQSLYLDLPYIDNDDGDAVNLYFYDYNDADNATVEIFGQKAKVS